MITLIAAIGLKNELGKDNDLIWHLPADLKRFKKITTGHTLVMGRKTFESIGKPLPNRKTVIVSRNTNYHFKGCTTVNSIEEAIGRHKKEEKLFIVGGAEIYRQAIEKKWVDQLDITLVGATFKADVFFPEIKIMDWKLSSRQDFLADDKNPYNYSFLTFTKANEF